jgi:hypothetical protein
MTTAIQAMDRLSHLPLTQAQRAEIFAVMQEVENTASAALEAETKRREEIQASLDLGLRYLGILKSATGDDTYYVCTLCGADRHEAHRDDCPVTLISAELETALRGESS